jgi:hypothetical protein
VCPELKTIRARVASLPLSFVKGKGETRGIRLKKEKGRRGIRPADTIFAKILPEGIIYLT